MLPFLLCVVWCAVSQHVSESISRHADVNHQRPSNSLQPSGRAVVGVYIGGWGPWRRSSTFGSPTSQCHLCCPRAGEAGRKHSTVGSSGFPCGPYLQPCEAHTTYKRRGRLGCMVRHIALLPSAHGRADGDEGTCSFGGARTQNENDPDTRSGGRWGVHRAGRRLKSCLVPTVPINGGGLPAGRGGPHLRTTQCLAEENFGARHGTLRGLCHLRPIWSQSIEGIEVQDVRTDIIRLHDEGVAGPCNIHPVANVLQVVENVPHNAGRSGPRGVARVRDGHRKIVEDVSIGLAFDICCRRSCKVIPVKQTSIKSTDGRKGRETTSGWLQPEQTMGLCVPHPGEGRNVLQNTGSHPCPCMDRVRKSWSPEDTSRAVSLQLPPRWIGRHSTRHGERHRHEGNTTEQPQEEEKVGQRRWRRWRRPQTFKRLGRKERREQRKRRSEMLRLEQRQRALWGLGAGATMCSKGQTSTPLHEVRLPRSSKPKLHEERVRSNAADDNDPKTGAAKQETTEGAKSPNSYTYTYETEDEEEKGGDDGGDEGPQEETPLQAETLEEYYTKRVFIFIHHYAGAEDPLTTAMRNETLAQGIRLKAISVEKSNGSGDLLADEPYATHLRWARRGYIDAYHAGFPCSTFSRLRWRRAPNMPGPVRSAQEPYGMKANTAAEQAECDRGTIMACRAIDMATAVCQKPQITTIPPVATLENPPPSNTEGHMSAWELSEMDKFRSTMPHYEVEFNTCGYESRIPIGKKHYKPQRFEGSLQGLGTLRRECQCGYPGNHEVITGQDRSKASATYPGELCREYAKLAI